MKFRQAKKILYSHSYVEKLWRKRPPYVNEEGRLTFPSLHDIDRIRRARKVFVHHIKRNKK